MKSKKKAMLLLVFLFIIMSVVSVNNVIAIKYSGNMTTTLTDQDGLDVEVANISISDTMKIEDYIKANMNKSLVGDEKFEAKDIIMIKNILADGTILGDINTVTDMWKNVPEAYLFLNYYYMPLLKLWQLNLV